MAPPRIRLPVLRADRPPGPPRLVPLAAILVWAPLPLASNRPWSTALLLLLLFALAAWSAMRGDRPPPTRAGACAFTLAGIAVTWALVQAAPGLGTALPHWQDLAALTGRPPWGALSLTPVSTVEGTLRLIGYGTAAWLGAAVLGPPAARLGLMRVLAAGTAGLAIYALADLLSGSHRIGWIDKWIYQDVATATFVNRNAWCVYAGLGAAAALVAAGAAVTRQRRRLWQAAAALTLVAALLSESRWGLVSVAAGLGTLALLRPGRPPWRALAAGGTALLAAPLGLAALGWDRLLARLDPVLVLGDLRWDLYRVTLEAIAAAPWTGHGLGSYPVLYHHIRDAALAEALVLEAHSVPLELLAELGIPAALALMGAYVVLVAAAVRRARRHGDPVARLAAAAGVMAGLHGLLDFSMQTPALAVTVLVLLGAGATPSTPPGPARSPAPAAPAPPPGP
ncbi:O-antigen ligase family protein [Roseospira goensis]|uniref:O-antigen ligase-related domain-containing protein n=1 Tax=Roseospira goensis TaxID=391922 RepID=A0A7W6RYZ0_9PROT|nr:O-antigen ligase family protein [Roseospira goensis]MBB4285829.1 hypothetical protein [Roseospira goensis]